MDEFWWRLNEKSVKNYVGNFKENILKYGEYNAHIRSYISPYRGYQLKCKIFRAVCFVVNSTFVTISSSLKSTILGKLGVKCNFF